MNRATARPDMSVSASAGSIRPRFVVNVTCVPLCGALPDASMICAMICVVPFAGRAVVATVSVMLEPEGASRGTFSHAAVESAATARTTPRAAAERRRDTMRTVTILIPMQLAGQVKSTRAERCTSAQGYAMAALLIAMSVMAIMMTVVMPVWKQAAQREKEEELVFR